MPGFVVDPLMVTTPAPDCTDDGFLTWLRTLELWLDEVASSPFEWRHFLRCSFRLQEIGRFPTFRLLREAVRARGMDVNVRRIMARIDAFFQDENRDLFATIATRYSMVDGEAPEVIPAGFISRNLPAIHGELLNALMCLACDREAGEPFAKSVHLATLPFRGQVDAVSIRGRVVLVDPEEMLDRLPKSPLLQKMPVLFSPGDFQTRVEDILEGGFDVYRAAVVRLARRLYRDVALLPFSAGTEFWQSLWDSTINTNHSAVDKLLRVSAAIVASHLDDIKAELRPVRSSVGPQSAQRIRERDGARGWRYVVTRKGIGWRLHYWHVPARPPRQPECIEFANIIRMREVPRIPE